MASIKEVLCYTNIASLYIGKVMDAAKAKLAGKAAAGQVSAAIKAALA
jgi:uncharacterized protein YqeY